MELVVLLALLTMWVVVHLRKLSQEILWRSSDVDCFDSRSDLTSVCSGTGTGHASGTGTGRTSEEDSEERRVSSWNT